MRSEEEIEAMVDALHVLIAAEKESPTLCDDRTIDLQVAALAALRWALGLPHARFDDLMERTLKATDEYVEKLLERARRRGVN